MAGLPFLALAGGVTFFIVRKRIAAAKLGEVDASVTGTVRPGEDVRVRLSFRARDRLRLGGITAKLAGVERAVRGSGTDRTVHARDLHAEELTLREAGVVSRLQEVTHEATLRVPPGAAPSLSVRDNEVAWTVEVRVDIAGWPDWIHVAPVVVLPA